MSVSPEALALLRLLTPEYTPTRDELVGRVPGRPWLVDELEEGGLIGNVEGGYVPTPAGMVRTTDPLLPDARRVLAFLATKPGHEVTGGDLVTAVPIANPTVVKRSTHAWLAAVLSSASGTPVERRAAKRGRVERVYVTGTIAAWDPFTAGENAAAPPDLPPTVTLALRDFRGLRDVRWEIPTGVSLLVGPNGAGKSSILGALTLLRHLFAGGPVSAIGGQRGADGLVHLHADEGFAQVTLTAGQRWQVQLPAGDPTQLGEEFGDDGAAPLLFRQRNATTRYLRGQREPANDHRSTLRVSWDRQADPGWRPFVELVQHLRVHPTWALGALRDGGQPYEDNVRLAESGANALHVLRNWKLAEVRYEQRYEWVLGHLRRAFPGLVERLEFGEPIGERLPMFFYPVGSARPLQVQRAADGFLAGLLHLTAIAGAPHGSVLAIDELENQLHPHAIRAVLAAARERAETHALRLVFTTHSPVVMNVFRAEPERFWVLQPGEGVLPVRLDQLHDPDWLVHFQLGELYEKEEFGAPEPEPAGRESR
jgi:predicted ATPase